MDLRALLLAPTLLVGCSDAPAPDVADVELEAFPATLAGRWAADPELCGRFGWRVGATAITSDSGMACTLDSLRPNAGGWTGMATCIDGREGVVELDPTPGEPATLVISGAPFAAPLNLVRCALGDPPERDPHAPLEAAAQVDLAIAAEAEGISTRTDPENAVVRVAWWRDGELIKIVEPTAGVGGGTRRSYYFRPGEAQPFLIRTDKGALALKDGQLMTAYSPEGEVLDDLARQGMDEDARRAVSNAEVARTMAAALKPDTSAAAATSDAP